MQGQNPPELLLSRPSPPSSLTAPLTLLLQTLPCPSEAAAPAQGPQLAQVKKSIIWWGFWVAEQA